MNFEDRLLEAALARKPEHEKLDDVIYWLWHAPDRTHEQLRSYLESRELTLDDLYRQVRAVRYNVDQPAEERIARAGIKQDIDRFLDT